MCALGTWLAMGLALIAVDVWVRFRWRLRHPFKSYDDYLHD